LGLKQHRNQLARLEQPGGLLQLAGPSQPASLWHQLAGVSQPASLLQQLEGVNQPASL
jgi:hypothetical protein